MNPWPAAPLGDVCTFLNGGTPSRSVASYWDGTIPWITGADIDGPTVIRSRSSVTEEGLRASATNRVPAGTLLLVTRTSVGKVATAGIELCFSQDITAVIPDDTSLETQYLRHFLAARAGALKSAARGATIQGVSRRDVAGLTIPLPPLAEQRRIAAILDAADALRAKRRATISALDTLTQSIFLDMFGDPATNPRSWPTGTLAELGSLDRGVSKHRPRNDPRLLGGAWPLIQTGDVARANGLLTRYSTTYSDAGLAQSRLWPKGTLCITIAANIADTAVLGFDACFPDSVVGFTAHRRSDVVFVRAWFTFLQRSIQASAPESAQKNINLKILKALTLPLPPTHTRDRFAALVGRVEHGRLTAFESLGHSETLFASLQSRAFRADL